VLLGTFVPSVVSIDETILRTRGMFAVETDQSAASENQLGAFGMIIVSDNAAAAGVASIPGPATEASDDGWFVWVPIVQRWELGTFVGFDSHQSVQYEIDSKAKRIVQAGQTIAVVVESVASGFTIATVFRMLSQVRGTR